MSKKVYFWMTFLTFMAINQLPTLILKTDAQTEVRAERHFNMPKKMEIDPKFKYSKLSISQQQKEAWSNDLFKEDSSPQMKLEDLQTITLPEVDPDNGISASGIEFIKF